MRKSWTMLGASLFVLIAAGRLAQAGNEPMKTLQESTDAVKGLCDIPLNGIPRALVNDAAGVAIIPHLVKTALIVDREFGHGVLLAHEPSGAWSNPIFVTLSGGGVGGQAGIQATELVLVFKTRKSFDRALAGKLTLGSDMSVAAGPLGRDSKIATDKGMQSEIYSYSRSRGLFVGLSLEGAKLHVDDRANELFYGLRGCRAPDVLAWRGAIIPPVEALKAQLMRLSPPPAVIVVPGSPPPVFVPSQPPPLPPAPVPVPPPNQGR
jgi:lipid-binding SYLF domain-containing protein